MKRDKMICVHQWLRSFGVKEAGRVRRNEN